jgi:hypothetical protein
LEKSQRHLEDNQIRLIDILKFVSYGAENKMPVHFKEEQINSV